MGKSCRTGGRRSAQAAQEWAQICAAARVVIERAQERRQLSRMGLNVDASRDTLGRMLDDPQHGGWTGARLVALREWEEVEHGTTTIRDAWNGAITTESSTSESAANKTLCAVLDLSRQLAAMASDGIDIHEARVLDSSHVLDDAIEALALLKHGIREKMKRGGK